MPQIELGGISLVEVLAGGSRITLSCGAVIDGRPHTTASYRATARDLGYGEDGALAMCRDHDPLHALLCNWLGLGDSIALRCAAGLRSENKISAAEESAVLAVQRFMRLAGGTPAGMR
jgi:hypothetical protein